MCLRCDWCGSRCRDDLPTEGGNKQEGVLSIVKQFGGHFWSVWSNYCRSFVERLRCIGRVERFRSICRVERLRCIWGAFAVHLGCVCGAFAVRLRCVCGAFAVRLRCVCGAFTVRLRCVYGAFAVRLRNLSELENLGPSY
jgi:hypothetical protein